MKNIQYQTSDLFMYDEEFATFHSRLVHLTARGFSVFIIMSWQLLVCLTFKTVIYIHHQLIWLDRGTFSV